MKVLIFYLFAVFCSVENIAVTSHISITIFGLTDPLAVGQSATIGCMTNTSVTSIEWMDQSSSVLNMSSDMNLTVLEYTIPPVTDDLHGQQFSCRVVAGNTTYTETVEIKVKVSAGSLVVEIVVSEDGVVEAGSVGLSLICTVREVISGLTNMPSAHWMRSSGPVVSGEGIVVTETFRNATTAAVTITFSSLHTSHAGQYTCQGTLVSPAAQDDVISILDSGSVTVRLPTPALSLSVPSGPLYEGTSHTLTCTVTLPDTVDTDVTVTVQWTPDTTSDRVMISAVSSMRSPFISTLTLSPVIMTDAGQYSCEATAHSVSQYITSSSQGQSSMEIITVNALPTSIVIISFSGYSIAGQNYSLQCSASVVTGLVVLPDLKIVFPNSTVMSVMNSSSVEYMFSALRTSDGGQYTCTATVNIPQAGIADLRTSVTENIIVAIPIPTVTFTGQLVSPVDPSTPLYSSTVFTLTCVVELVSEVDTSVTVLTSWTKTGKTVTNTDRISVSSEAAEITSFMYASDVVFDPLSNMQSGGDDGDYTCSVQVRDDKYITGSNSSGMQTLSVEDLDPPMVWLISDAISTGGETFSLECMVMTEEGVRLEDISIMWTGPYRSIPRLDHRQTTTGSVFQHTDSGQHMMMGNLTTADGVVAARLILSPPHTSDRGQYSCTGRISVTSVDVDVSDSDSMEINVTVPAPDVSVSLNILSSGTVYQGTVLVITCTATVNTAVDTEFDVNMTWSSEPAEVMDGPYVTISDTSGSGHEYTSTVTISPVDTTDSATYTCTASVTSTDSDDSIISSVENDKTVDIIVAELMAPLVYEDDLVSTAGQPVTLECRFSGPPNLIRAPSVQWLNSTGSVVSNTRKLNFSLLLTSDGGVYTCSVTIAVPELDISMTNVGSTSVTAQIPAPSVVIERVSMPFNGTQYILSCTVTVDDSVNTDITISSQWLDSMNTVSTTPDRSERMSLVQRHNLTFSPLRSQDQEMYTCTATVSPEEESQFIRGTSANNTSTVTVKELPVPIVNIIINSSAGSQADSCLNVMFTDSSNSDSLTCVASVVSNLLQPPIITIMRDGSEVKSAFAHNMLTHSLSDDVTGEFICEVCIEAAEAGIVNHCNSSTVEISSDVPGQITPEYHVNSDSMITIDWRGSNITSKDILRYIVDVRRYLSDGPGKTKTESIRGYPREIPATQLQLSLGALSAGVPYQYISVAGNVHGCGEKYRSPLFFTQEKAPSTSPHNVIVDRVNGTAMSISFVKLSLVEARRLNVTYFITYAPSSSEKSEDGEMRVTVSDGSSHRVINGLDPDTEYIVTMFTAADSDGTNSGITSEPVTVPLFRAETAQDCVNVLDITTVTVIIGGAVVIALIIAITLIIIALILRKHHENLSVRNARKLDLTGQPHSAVVEGVAVKTTSNAAYEMMKQGEEPEDGYELVASPPRYRPPAGQEGVYEILSPPPNHEPHLVTPLAVGGTEEEGGVYETIEYK